jgi:hypothetical protein
MLTMSITAMLVAAVSDAAPALNIPLASLTFYLVVTSLLTVRPPESGARWLNIAGMAMAFAIGTACFGIAINAITRGGAAAGLGYILIPFGAVAVGAGVGDKRMIRAGGLRGAPRLARHLWRMCFALCISSIAFFLGPGRIPEAMRNPVLLGGGVLLPIVAMAYWLGRLRGRSTLIGRSVSLGESNGAGLMESGHSKAASSDSLKLRDGVTY